MRSRMTVDQHLDDGAGGLVVLSVSGVLEATTYAQLRDAIVKAALGGPPAVIVDVDAMAVSTPSALAAFTSARWHVSQWPDVAIIVTAADPMVRRAFSRAGVERYVPVYPTVSAAASAVAAREHRYRRRVVLRLHDGTPLARAQFFVDEHLQAWQMSEYRLAVGTVTRALVENAMTHGRGGGALRLETDGGVITVAVSDDNPAQAVRRERRPDVVGMHGLDIVAALSRSWHNSPTGTGKTVWAIVGPEHGLVDLAKAIE